MRRIGLLYKRSFSRTLTITSFTWRWPPPITLSADNDDQTAHPNSGMSRTLLSNISVLPSHIRHSASNPELFSESLPDQTFSGKLPSRFDCEEDISEPSPSLRSQHAADAYVPGILTSSTKGPLAAASRPKEALKAELGRIRRALSMGRTKFMSLPGRLTEDKE